jgi:DNA polymerase-4
VKPDRIRKSIGAEDTFREDIQDLETASAGLQPLIDKVWRHCEANGIRGKTVALKVKWEDFTQITRSRTVVAPLASPAEIANIVTLCSLDDDDQGEPWLALAL